MSCDPRVARILFDSVPDQGSSIAWFPFDDAVVDFVRCSLPHVLLIFLLLCEESKMTSSKSPSKNHILPYHITQHSDNRHIAQ